MVEPHAITRSLTHDHEMEISNHNYQLSNRFLNLEFLNLNLFENWNLKIGNSRLKAGYTLIEILVAITIVGILFGVGYANFRSFSQRQVIINAAKTIQGDLRLVQERALAGQKPTDPACNTPNTLNGYNFKILSTGLSGTPPEYEVRANCSGGIVSEPTKDVILSSDLSISIPNPNPIIFNILGNGTNITSGQTVTLTVTQNGSGSTSSITIASGGQIQ